MLGMQQDMPAAWVLSDTSLRSQSEVAWRSPRNDVLRAITKPALQTRCNPCSTNRRQGCRTAAQAGPAGYATGSCLGQIVPALYCPVQQMLRCTSSNTAPFC